MDSWRSTLHLANASLNRKANILLYLTDRIGPDTILHHLAPGLDLNIRVICKRRQAEIVDDDYQSFPDVEVYGEIAFATSDEECALLAQQSHQHARWADILFVEMDADTISAMLAGLAYNTILSVLRSWNISKKVVILPELSIDQWRNPMWKRQMIEIQSKWTWIQVLRPALWNIASEGRGSTDQVVDFIWDWEGPGEAIKAIHAEAKKLTRKRQPDLLLTPENTISPYDKFSSAKTHHHQRATTTQPRSELPSEIWTLIFEYLGDWEYATALGIYTTLPTPTEWLPHIPRSPTRPQTLEYTLLTGSTTTIRTILNQNSSSTLSPWP